MSAAFLSSVVRLWASCRALADRAESGVAGEERVGPLGDSAAKRDLVDADVVVRHGA
jgi:hypothetical protein